MIPLKASIPMMSSLSGKAFCEAQREVSICALVAGFIKRAVIEVVTEILEPKVRTIVREEMERKWQEWEPRIREIVREEMDMAFEQKRQEWEPKIRNIVREEMRTGMEEEWMPKLREMWRADIREETQRLFEETWLPKLQLMWRSDIQRLEERFQARFDTLQVRLDTISETVIRFVDFRMREWADLEKDVKEIRSDLEKVKAHIGLTGGNEP